jgi:hypothetical protein
MNIAIFDSLVHAPKAFGLGVDGTTPVERVLSGRQLFSKVHTV